jgi:hypothetical protein
MNAQEFWTLVVGAGCSFLLLALDVRLDRASTAPVAIGLGPAVVAYGLGAFTSHQGQVVFGVAIAGAAIGVSIHRATHTGRRPAPASVSTWLILLGVLVCSSGLTVLVARRMGWPAFVAMTCILVLTKREFDGFTRSQRALDQTVKALDSLAGIPTA